jgi:hypothetical protein
MRHPVSARERTRLGTPATRVHKPTRFRAAGRPWSPFPAHVGSNCRWFLSSHRHMTARVEKMRLQHTSVLSRTYSGFNRLEHVSSGRFRTPASGWLEQLFLRFTGANRNAISVRGRVSACVLAMCKVFSYFGQNHCTLLGAAQEAAGKKGSRLRRDWRGI